MLITSNFDEWLSTNAPSNLGDFEALKAIGNSPPDSHPDGQGWHTETIGKTKSLQYHFGSYSYQDMAGSRFVIGSNAILWLQSSKAILVFNNFMNNQQPPQEDIQQETNRMSSA